MALKLIIKCFFALKNYKTAAKLLRKHKDDWGIEFVYGRLLLAIINNEKEKLEFLLTEAIKRNKFVPEDMISSFFIL